MLLPAAACASSALPDEVGQKVDSVVVDQVMDGGHAKAVVLFDDGVGTGRASGAGIEVGREMAHLPFAAVTVSSEDGLVGLAGRADVAHVYADRRHALADADVDAVGAELGTALANQGDEIVLVGSGVDFTDPAFACEEPGDGCSIEQLVEIAADDASADDDGAGTALAAAVLAAAPSARIIAVDVVGADGTAATSDVLAAIDFAIDAHGVMDVALVHLDVNETTEGAGALGIAVDVAGRAGVTLPAMGFDGGDAIVRRSRQPSSGSWSPAASEARPTPFAAPTATSVSINGGAAYTTSPTVVLTLAAAGAAQMCISNTTTCTAWRTYGISAAWTLASGSGTRTVNVWYRDATGIATASPAIDTIILDASLPTNGSFTAIGSASADDEVELSWNGFSDAGTGLASYKLVFSTTAYPVDCRAPDATAIASSAAAFTHTHASLTAGTTYFYRLCAVDVAGNISTGVTAKARPASQFVPPNAVAAGPVTIAADAEYTKVASVTIALDAEDAADDPPATMCLSNTTKCTTFVAFAASKQFTLASGNGIKTVYVYFRDSEGNTNAAPFVDTIVLDATAPINGKVSADTSVTTDITLNWSGFTDATTGIASYKVVFATGTTIPAAGCTNGTVLTSGTNIVSFTGSGATPGTTYNHRVCAVDAAGNTSTGTTLSVVAE